MPMQKRNPEAVGLLSNDFTTLDEFFLTGVNIMSVGRAVHRDGGGRHRFSWLGDDPVLNTAAGPVVMTETSIADVNYAATVNGGPYVSLDGVADYLSTPDAAWQELTTNTFLVWTWFRFSAVVANFQWCIGKYNNGTNNDSWGLYWNNVTGRFEFLVCATGNPANDVWVVSSKVTAANTWYFAAGYFQPSTLLRVFVGEPTDAALTIDSVVAGVPASCFDGNTALTVGACFQGAGATWFWNGYLSLFAARCNVPAANVNSHVTRLFHMTRRLYM